MDTSLLSALNGNSSIIASVVADDGNDECWSVIHAILVKISHRFWSPVGYQQITDVKKYHPGTSLELLDWLFLNQFQLFQDVGFQTDFRGYTGYKHAPTQMPTTVINCGQRFVISVNHRIDMKMLKNAQHQNFSSISPAGQQCNNHFTSSQPKNGRGNARKYGRQPKNVAFQFLSRTRNDHTRC